MAAGKYCRNQRCFGRAHLHLREGCPAGLLVSQGILEQRADQLLFGVRVQAKFAGQASRSMKGGWAQPADTPQHGRGVGRVGRHIVPQTKGEARRAAVRKETVGAGQAFGEGSATPPEASE
jgi:hypothetical protein